ncbi:MAG: hypothetical protein M3Q07_22225 [Pseudobdellovibrionaceae bacterium]|nr:hypothetical protein [Pseudobdellovibrionaceae bacterium]
MQNAEKSPAPGISYFFCKNGVHEISFIQHEKGLPSKQTLKKEAPEQRGPRLSVRR